MGNNKQIFIAAPAKLAELGHLVEAQDEENKQLKAQLDQAVKALKKATEYMERTNFYRLLDDRLSPFGVKANLNLLEEMQAAIAATEDE